MKRNTTYRIFTVIFMAVILFTMMSITVYAEAPQERKPEVSTFDELSGKTISMLTGAPFEELISSKVPDVKEFTYYSTSSDMALALTSGKTDAFLQNTAVGELFVNRNPSLALFPEPLKEAEFGIAFSKGSKERSKWQAAYDKVCAGVIDELWEKWTGLDDSVKNLPVQDREGKNGTIRVAACDSLEPMSYLNGDGELKGMEIELILMMAKELDYKVRFTSMEFSGILAAVESGKADMCCGSLIITDQRREVVDFIPHHDTAYNMPDELSGGQKQRVAIARALAMHPQIMLYDEPTSALDPTMVTEVKNVIRHLFEDGMTMLVVTHEMRLARDISTRVLYMDQGEIYEQGTPEEIFTSPKRELTRAFVLRITSWNWETSENGRDFIAMIAFLEEFCRSRFMSRKMMNNCEMVFEEIYSNYFLPLFEKEKNSNAQFILEAQGENEKLTLTVITEGTETDPFSAEIDETAALILKSKAVQISTAEKNTAVFEIRVSSKTI